MVFLCIGGFYLIRILRNISSVSDTIKQGVTSAGKSIQDIRGSSLISLFFGKPKQKNKKK